MIPLPPSDYISVVKKRMKEKWNTLWVKANTKKEKHQSASGTLKV